FNASCLILLLFSFPTRRSSDLLPVKMAFMPWRVLDMRRVVGKLNRSHFDIVHIHWASYGVLGLASRIPYIVHCHGGDVRHRLQRSEEHTSELQSLRHLVCRLLL